MLYYKYDDMGLLARKGWFTGNYSRHSLESSFSSCQFISLRTVFKLNYMRNSGTLLSACANLVCPMIKPSDIYLSSVNSTWIQFYQQKCLESSPWDESESNQTLPTEGSGLVVHDVVATRPANSTPSSIQKARIGKSSEKLPQFTHHKASDYLGTSEFVQVPCQRGCRHLAWHWIPAKKTYKSQRWILVPGLIGTCWLLLQQLLRCWTSWLGWVGYLGSIAFYASLHVDDMG